MSITTETEILDRLKTSLRKAIEDCRLLAWHPYRGRIYQRFRDDLMLVAGCCRQMAAYRFDTRWLPIELQIHELRQRCGRWIRDHIAIESRKVAHPMFQMASQALEMMLYIAERVETGATGKTGPILPEAAPAPHRDTRPVSTSGLILPPGFRRKKVA